MKVIVLVLVVAFGGSSASVLRCELLCADRRSTPGDGRLCHDHGDGSARIGDAGHTCAHQDATVVAVRSSSVNTETALTVAAVTPLVSVPLLATAHRAAMNTSPPGSGLLAAVTRTRPLRI